MNDILIKKIFGAYGDSITMTEANHTYKGWLELNEKSLGSINRQAKDEILGSLVADKIKIIENLPAKERKDLFDADCLAVVLGEIDQRVSIWAEQVLKGRPLTDDERIKAQKDQIALDAAKNKLTHLPEKFRGALADQYGEMILDLNYALEDGHGPKSFRLNQAIEK